MAGRDVALIVALGTMGIAFPFVFAATGLIYGLCVAPSVVFWPAGGRVRAAGIVATIVLVVFTALAPYYFGHYAADAAAAVLRAVACTRRQNAEQWMAEISARKAAIQ
jgi:hypothetical protein